MDTNIIREEAGKVNPDLIGQWLSALTVLLPWEGIIFIFLRQNENVGELITADRFTDAYVNRNGMPPVSYFLNRGIEMHGTVPDIASMNLFLRKGEIWDEPPWKKVAFVIPEAGREEAAKSFLLLWPDFVGARRMTHQLSNIGKIVGSKFILLGTLEDDRGRPIIEGLMDEPGKVWKVNYARRQPAQREGFGNRQKTYASRRKVIEQEAQEQYD